MIIGAVSAMISGATFSAFTDEETATGSLSTGNVFVSLGGSDNLSFTPCTDPIGSDEVCTATVNVTYGGANSLPALLDFDLEWGATSCFAVELEWDGSGAAVSDSGTASPLGIADQTAESGVVTITVEVRNVGTGFDQAALNACQDATTGTMTLTVTATETT